MNETITSRERILGDILCVIRSTMPVGIVDNTRKVRHSECFVYILSGHTDYIFDDKTLSVSAGDVLYLAKGSRYKMIIREPYSVIYTDLELSPPRSDTYLSSELYRSPQTAEEKFRKLLSLWTRKNESSASMTECRAILYSLYAILLKNGETKGPKKYKKMIEPALEMISEHLYDTDSDILIGDLADLCGMSETHFRRIFCSCIGMPPVKYIALLKLKRAKEMLLYDTSGLSITAIAETLGYSGIFYFSKCFKKEFGMTPNEYRKMMRK